MRQGPHNKRGRGRGGNNNRRSGTPNRNQTFDSNGPDVRIRGNANQVHEKYLNLARDAAQNGDRVLAESYFQHAEHYYRILSAFAEEAGGDPNRNRGNGFQHGMNDDAQGNQFHDDDPQPEFNLGAPGASNGQSGASVRDENAGRPIQSAVEPDRGAEVEASEPMPAEMADDDAPGHPGRRPLSLRRRRNGSDGSEEQRDADRTERSGADGPPVTPGVTVTVVGAPVADGEETQLPQRPRRRPRPAVEPNQPEENPGD